ncbi:hypothetical protein LZ30DRAFT_404985 [Colletotrichum cereale]|nr:hypothetical protein LZ30DRAFT_404985 [Colletotrichum cereale]
MSWLRRYKPSNFCPPKGRIGKPKARRAPPVRPSVLLGRVCPGCGSARNWNSFKGPSTLSREADLGAREGDFSAPNGDTDTFAFSLSSTCSSELLIIPPERKADGLVTNVNQAQLTKHHGPGVAVSSNIVYRVCNPLSNVTDRRPSGFLLLRIVWGRGPPVVVTIMSMNPC